MNKVTSRNRAEMLQLSAEGGTLAEEVISSVRNTHAFGTQKRLSNMYDIKNRMTEELGSFSSSVRH
jgi:ATP-binding cassette subfamily B (MDR/TAP) protein 1